MAMGPTSIRIYSMATDEVVGGGSLTGRLKGSTLIDGSFSDTHDLCTLLCDSGELLAYKVSAEGSPNFISSFGDMAIRQPTEVQAYGR